MPSVSSAADQSRKQQLISGWDEDKSAQSVGR
jgi:hypothetical protein